MFKKGQYVYYENKMVQVAQTQTDKLVYIIIDKKCWPPDTVWANMDEIRPVCPTCKNVSDFDQENWIILCDDCATEKEMDHHGMY